MDKFCLLTIFLLGYSCVKHFTLLRHFARGLLVCELNRLVLGSGQSVFRALLSFCQTGQMNVDGCSWRNIYKLLLFLHLCPFYSPKQCKNNKKSKRHGHITKTCFKTGSTLYRRNDEWMCLLCEWHFFTLCRCTIAYNFFWKNKHDVYQLRCMP